MKREQITNACVFFLLVTLGVATRWISKANEPALSNFTATGAAALFAGYFYAKRFVAFLVPLAILVISNLWLAQYENVGQMSVVFFAMLVLPVVLGRLLRPRFTAWRLAGFSVLPAVAFFLVTNCVLWPGCDRYPVTLAGQYESYMAGLPFFRNTLAGDLLFAGLIFGAYWAAAAVGVVSRRLEPAPVPAAKNV